MALSAIKVILVIDGERNNSINVSTGKANDYFKYNWAEIFKEKSSKVQLFQCGWEDILNVSCDPFRSSKPNAAVEIKLSNLPKDEAAKHAKRNTVRVKPDFVLVRNEVRIPNRDCRNFLYGLMYSGVPSVNSLSSIYLSCERPIVHAELVKLKRELDVKRSKVPASGIVSDDYDFPLIEQVYFSSETGMMYGYQFPAVAKIGFAHAGAGKMLVNDHVMMEDFQSVLKMTSGSYCTVEPFIDGKDKFDLRIQKIGKDIRVFVKISVSGNWKSNVGTTLMGELLLPKNFQSNVIRDDESISCHYGESIESGFLEVMPQVSVKRFFGYCKWIENASKMFDGLDICTLDAVCCRDKNDQWNEVILELNDTSSGLAPFCEDEDNRKIRDLVLTKMEGFD